jgi:hypothetical protein
LKNYSENKLDNKPIWFPASKWYFLAYSQNYLSLLKTSWNFPLRKKIWIIKLKIILFHLLSNWTGTGLKALRAMLGKNPIPSVTMMCSCSFQHWRGKKVTVFNDLVIMRNIFVEFNVGSGTKDYSLVQVLYWVAEILPTSVCQADGHQAWDHHHRAKESRRRADNQQVQYICYFIH